MLKYLKLNNRDNSLIIINTDKLKFIIPFETATGNGISFYYDDEIKHDFDYKTKKIRDQDFKNIALELIEPL